MYVQEHMMFSAILFFATSVDNLHFNVVSYVLFWICRKYIQQTFFDGKYFWSEIMKLILNEIF